MNDVQIGALAGVDWAAWINDLRTVGLDFVFSLFIAFIIFYVGKIAARLIQKFVRRMLEKQEVDKILQTFVSNIVYWAVMAFVIIAAVGQLGIQTTSLVAALGAAGLAIGLALQGALSNFAAGVLIVLFRPYRVGDWIEAAGISGAVQQVQILTTVLKTGDNKSIIVPNAQIMSSIITNYSANDTRRIDLIVGVSYDDDLDKVRATIKSLVAADDRILGDPECTIAVAELADSSVNFTVRPWVNTDDYWAVKFDLTEAIKKRFDDENISIPFPQQDVHIHQQA